MTIAELCMPAMAVLAIAAVAPAKVAGRAEYDNANPRDPAFYTQGFRTRALGAHQNTLECLPLFFAAVLLAEFRGAGQGAADTLALAFVAARIAYIGAYWGDMPTLRSLVWAVGLAINLGLFAAAWAR